MMSEEAIAALDVAIRELKSEMQGDPRFALLSKLESAREAYAAAANKVVAGSVHPPVNWKPQGLSRKLSPGRARAYQLCKEALAGHTQPVLTRDLYTMIEDHGVSLQGGMNNLSSLLSRHPTVFEGHGRAGWTLKDAGNGAEPDSGANGEGSAPLFSSSQEGGEGHEATTTHH